MGQHAPRRGRRIGYVAFPVVQAFARVLHLGLRSVTSRFIMSRRNFIGLLGLIVNSIVYYVARRFSAKHNKPPCAMMHVSERHTTIFIIAPLESANEMPHP